jgi:tRNA pseudouridine13 synthase
LARWGEFIAQPWCKGDYEKALFLSIAEANVHDRPREKEQKAVLRDNWGNWSDCKDQLDRSHRRSIITYLVDHPTDFKRALALLRPDLRSIYMSAFQSFLWNRWLSAIIETRFESDKQTAMKSLCGTLWTPNAEATDFDWLKKLELPLPSARQHDWPQEYFPFLESILSQMDMDIHEVRVKFPRDTFFSKGIRAAWLNIAGLQFRFQPDEDRPSRQQLHLTFELPRGSYATMIVKHLKLPADE